MTILDLKNRYKAARVTLLGIIFFIIIDSFILSISPEAKLLFTVVTPQLAIAYARFYFSGFQATLIVLLFVVCPLLLNIICYILSKYERGWLNFSAFLAIVDFIVLIGFVIFYGFRIAMCIDIFVEICVLYYLIRGCFTGKRLNGDLIMDVVSDDPIDNPELNIKVYKYSESMAKKNKTKKGGLIVVGFLGLVIAIVIDAFLAGVISTFTNLSFELVTVIFMLILVLSVVGFCFFVGSIRPYTTAKNTQYFMLNDEVCRCFYEDIKTAERLKNFVVKKKTASEYICQFELANGKTKKLVIPNCYPGIDEILKK